MARFLKKKRIIKQINDDVIKLKLVFKSKAIGDPNWVPSFVYDIIRLSDMKVVGRCDLRIGMNPYMYYMGNLGYVIYPPYRGHRYATNATLLLFEIAKHHMSECIVTCNPDNIASIKTCEYAGCEYVEEVAVPDDHELVRQYEYFKRIYRKTLV